MASCRRSPVTMLAGVLAAFALLAACALTGPAVTTVHAWGYVGHQLTATVAQQLLSKDAELGVEQVLSHDRGNMTRVATWADEVKRQQRYRWSSTLHYVNPHDDE